MFFHVFINLDDDRVIDEYDFTDRDEIQSNLCDKLNDSKPFFFKGPSLNSSEVISTKIYASNKEIDKLIEDSYAQFSSTNIPGVTVMAPLIERKDMLNSPYCTDVSQSFKWD